MTQKEKSKVVLVGGLRFTYDKENDRYTCSRGVHLPFKGIKTTSLGYKMKVYRSSSTDCGTCPLRSTCIGKSDFKKIDDSIDKPYYDRMHARLQTSKARRMKKLRSSTVEPVIGTLVSYLGMKRVNTRGLKQANKCMLMAATVHNLKKLLNFRSNKATSLEKAMRIMAKNLQNQVLKLIANTCLAIKAHRLKMTFAYPRF